MASAHACPTRCCFVRTKALSSRSGNHSMQPLHSREQVTVAFWSRLMATARVSSWACAALRAAGHPGVCGGFVEQLTEEDRLESLCIHADIELPLERSKAAVAMA